jgi:DNA-binding Lrp family transcriptional regulator
MSESLRRLDHVDKVSRINGEIERIRFVNLLEEVEKVGKSTAEYYVDRLLPHHRLTEIASPWPRQKSYRRTAVSYLSEWLKQKLAAHYRLRLSEPDIKVLQELARLRKAKQLELARSLRQSQGYISKRVDRLTKLGLIDRTGEGCEVSGNGKKLRETLFRYSLAQALAKNLSKVKWVPVELLRGVSVPNRVMDASLEAAENARKVRAVERIDVGLSSLAWPPIVSIAEGVAKPKEMRTDSTKTLEDAANKRTDVALAGSIESMPLMPSETQQEVLLVGGIYLDWGIPIMGQPNSRAVYYNPSTFHERQQVHSYAKKHGIDALAEPSYAKQLKGHLQDGYAMPALEPFYSIRVDESPLPPEAAHRVPCTTAVIINRSLAEGSPRTLAAVREGFYRAIDLFRAPRNAATIFLDYVDRIPGFLEGMGVSRSTTSYSEEFGAVWEYLA